MAADRAANHLAAAVGRLAAAVDQPVAVVDHLVAAVDQPVAAADPPVAEVDPPEAAVDPPVVAVDPLAVEVKGVVPSGVGVVESVAEPTSLIVAIDGTSGVGKSTVAGLLAARLEVPMLDTGATYRSVALKVLESGTDLDDRTAVIAAAAQAELKLQPAADGGFEVLLDGRPVGQRIRTPKVSDATSRISVHPEIRQRLVEVQRQTAARYGAVVEGRDIGSVVFPRTPHKFFLYARPQVRAERRHAQLVAAGEAPSLSAVLRNIEERDDRDSRREASPLVCDESYYPIDTSDLSVAEIVERMVEEIDRKRQGRAPAAV